MAQAQPAAGFTLIELVIALAIVAITTMIAASSYRSQVRRSHRLEAVQALLVAAAEEEKFHLANGSYGNRLDAAVGSEPPGLPVASRTPGGHYALSIPTATAAEFRIVAIAVSDDADPLCRTMAVIRECRKHTARTAA